MKSTKEEIEDWTEQLALIDAEVAMHAAELSWELWDDTNPKDTTRMKYLELRVDYLNKIAVPLREKLDGAKRYANWDISTKIL